MKTISAFFLIVLLCFTAHSQSQTSKEHIDSLMSELSKSRNDTVKIRILQDISFAWSQSNPDKGIAFAKQAIVLSGELKTKKWLASSYGMLAISYNAKADYKTAILYNDKALAIYQQLKEKKSRAAIFANQSLIQLTQGNYSEALKNSFAALKIYEESKTNRNTGIVLENIGHIYYDQKNYPQTEQYYNRALSIYKKAGQKEDVARALGNLSRVFLSREEYPKALQYLNKALETNKKAGDLNSIQNNLANIGNVFAKLGNYKKAIDYHSRALAMSKKVDSESSTAINYGNLGCAWLELAKAESAPPARTLALAISNLQQAVGICERIGFNAPLSEFNQALVDAYALRGDYKEAFDLLGKNTALKDSIFSMQSKLELSGLETKRNLELKDKDVIIQDKQLQIKKLQLTNERILYLSGILLLCLILFLVVRYIIRRTREHRSAMAHIINIQSHKIRGPVPSILGLAQLLNHNDPNDPDNPEMLKGIYDIASQLDKVITGVVEEHNPAKGFSSRK